MPKDCNKLQMRGVGRGNFSNNFYNIDYNDSLLDFEGREVRMGGDTLMAGVRPRISFKPKQRTVLTRNVDLAFLNGFDDDDLQMSVCNNNNGFDDRQVTLKGRGRNSVYGRLGTFPTVDLRQKLTQVVLADAYWYKIIIPCGANFNKDFLIKKILDHIAPYTFVPILYQNQDRSATFFVEDIQTAKKLLSCDNRVFLNDNFRLHVFAKPGHPQCKIDHALKDKILHAVVKRYDQQTNTLNLSRFHQDPDLVENYFCALYQPAILTAVLEFAVQHFSHLQKLNLNGNKFTLVDRLGSLKAKFSNLKSLDLGNNLLKEINLIDPLKNLQLEELHLSGNPFCESYFMRHNIYVSDVRQKFPKLLRLDLVDLPPPISFDVVEEGLHIPSSEKTFAVNQEVNNIAAQFLQQYFAIYDSESRQPLIDAYHENAVFSMTTSPSLVARPNSYFGESRNLLRVNDPQRRRKMLKRGRLSVLSTISQFPRTKHDWQSFTMDVAVCSETMMLVTVTGLFKEASSMEIPFRYFNRAFVIVPEGGGYCILNEQFCIHNATQLQQKRAMDRVAANEESIINGHPEIVGITEDVKQKMVEELSQGTHMNMAWSYKCLNEVQWNYESALSAFQQFFNEGRIPAEAFEK